MYGGVHYDKKTSTIHWSEYDEDDVRMEYRKKWVPDFYIDPQTGEGDYRSQEGKVLTRIVESTWKKRRDLIKLHKDGNRKVYGSDLSPENKFILERWPQDLIAPPKIRFMFIDIETEIEGGFPEAERARERVNLITCWSSFSQEFTTFGLEHDYDSPNYHKCEDEEELLEKFIKYIETNRFDIWSGWHSSGFDIPYLFNRILRVLDGVDVEKHTSLLKDVKLADGAIKTEMQKEIKEIEQNFFHIHRLSHFGTSVKSIKMSRDVFTKEMKPSVHYNIIGVTDYDYLNLDQKYATHKRDSYKLDNVALDELGEKKVEYEGTLRELYKNDWKKFVEYNIQDVNLLVGLNGVLNYIPQSIALSYKCHCTFKDNMGTVTKAETAVYNFLFKDNIILDDRKDHKADQRHHITGGYVTQAEDLRRGLHKWIIDVDIASLYPSLMRGINISYDTRVAEVKIKEGKNLFECDDDEEVYLVNGDIKKFTAKQVVNMVKKKGYHVSSRGVIFKNVKTHKGVLVKMLDLWYSQRKADKKKQAEYRDKALDIFNVAPEFDGGPEIEENGVIKCFAQEDFDKYSEYMRLSGVHFNLQWSCKILLNSIYGCLGSSYSRFYGEDLAASVTLSGRTVIKHNGEMLNDFFNGEFWEMKVVKKNFPNIDQSIGDVDARLYTDTDSCIFGTLVRTNKGIFRIGDLYELYEEGGKHLSQYGHEIIDVSGEDLNCLTYNEQKNQAEYGKIKKLVRHKVTKKKWRIRVDGKEVIVTEDHCCVIRRKGEILRVKPKEINKKTDKIITIF